MEPQEQKTIVLTGGTNGIGREATHAFLSKGYTVLLVYRNQQKARQLKSQVAIKYPKSQLHLMPPCDFSKLDEVQRCAQYIAQNYKTIDFLVNNAGTALMSKQFSEGGIEKNFVVNHLAHFVLTMHLLPNLKTANHARIIHTSSEAHYKPNSNFMKDLNFTEKKYFVLDAYGNSKLANVMFAISLSEKLRNTNIVSHSFHPGRVKSGIWPRNTWYEKIFTFVLQLFLLSPAKGIRPLLMLAFDEKYHCRESIFLFKTKERRVNKVALDAQAREKLWDLSVEMCKPYLPPVTQNTSL